MEHHAVGLVSGIILNVGRQSLVIDRLMPMIVKELIKDHSFVGDNSSPK